MGDPYLAHARIVRSDSWSGESQSKRERSGAVASHRHAASPRRAILLSRLSHGLELIEKTLHLLAQALQVFQRRFSHGGE